MTRFYFVTLLNTLVLGALVVPVAFSMGTEEKGNKPLSVLNYTQWKGIVPLVNDKARVYQVWVNGNENLYYQGETKQLNAALATFAAMEVKNHVVVLRPGSASRLPFEGKTPIPYDWELHVIGGIAKMKVTDDIEDLEWQRDPVLTVYVGGNIEIDKIEIPEGITLRAAEGQNDEANRDEIARKKIERFLKRKSSEDAKTRSRKENL